MALFRKIDFKIALVIQVHSRDGSLLRISGVRDIWIGLDTSSEMFDIDSRTCFDGNKESNSWTC